MAIDNDGHKSSEKLRKLAVEKLSTATTPPPRQKSFFCK